MTKHRLRVLYITGWGHSGSTLLARLIDRAPGIACHGELKYFAAYCYRTSNEKIPNAFFCSCGADFDDCPFWTSVRTRMRPSEPPPEGAGLFFRLMTLARFLGGANLSGDDLRSELDLLEAVSTASDSPAKYLLDPSKDFTRLMRLMMIPGVDVVPIYLVRDVRAVAYSYGKREQNSEAIGIFSFTKSLLLWTAIHAVNQLVFRVRRLKPIHISYKGFCSRPDAYIAKLNELLDTAIPNLDGPVSDSATHYIGGNAMKTETIKKIREDNAWRQAYSASQRALYRMTGVSILNRRWALRDELVDD